jgi:hypothetical protein
MPKWKHGRCVYADDRVAIPLIHKTGTAPGGDRFYNLAVYISRLRPDVTRDVDAGSCRTASSWTRPGR